ncbi:fasciclin domain-containing protein [Leptolyngbya sp. KIOST-1]|uniref:fasciclin domain-containing protein n=1 Tax=Leptolyngbya sp. KIOST-1 TaxID=1229172 RepID=UPI000564E48C|nr:fasciclin domain-containing protein [Leptolyngbya sp. KIOST-1]
MRFSFIFRNAAIAAVAASASLLLGTTVQASNHTDGSMAEPQTQQQAQPGTAATMSIVDVANNSGSFDTLVQAVQAAGLRDTLAGEGPYTVFAPTDEAFNELPDGALDYLLQPENQDLLAEVLSYHVVPGSVTSDQLSTGGISALSGGVAIAVQESRIVVNNASVINPDIQADNGVIHGINRVLIPEALRQDLASRLGVESIY